MQLHDQSLLHRVKEARRGLNADGPTSERHSGDFGRVSLPLSDGDVLRDWLIVEGSHVVVEIGLAYGASALAIAEAIVTNGASAGSHVIIDPYQDEFDDVGWRALLSVGLSSLCSLERERSQVVLADMLDQGVVVDAAFVDGSHVFHNVFVDLFYLGELVRPGGLVVLDDCDWPSVGTAVRYYELNMGWQTEQANNDTRLRAYRLPDPIVVPGFDKFKPFGFSDHP